MGAFSHLAPQISSDMDSSYIGMLKKFCPLLYNSLSTWERETIESLVQEGSDTQCFSGGKPILESIQFLPSSPSRTTVPEDSVMSPPLPSEFPTVSTEAKDSTILLGCLEMGLGDNAPEHLLTTLIPGSTEVPSSINIPTYLVNSIVQPTNHLVERLGSLRKGMDLRNDPSWSWGLGMELSPIKT
jgi:hypothetical protein